MQLVVFLGQLIYERGDARVVVAQHVAVVGLVGGGKLHHEVRLVGRRISLGVPVLPVGAVLSFLGRLESRDRVQHLLVGAGIGGEAKVAPQAALQLGANALVHRLRIVGVDQGARGHVHPHRAAAGVDLLEVQVARQLFQEHVAIGIDGDRVLQQIARLDHDRRSRAVAHTTTLAGAAARGVDVDAAALHQTHHVGGREGKHDGVGRHEQVLRHDDADVSAGGRLDLVDREVARALDDVHVAVRRDCVQARGAGIGDVGRDRALVRADAVRGREHDAAAADRAVGAGHADGAARGDGGRAARIQDIADHHVATAGGGDVDARLGAAEELDRDVAVRADVVVRDVLGVDPLLVVGDVGLLAIPGGPDLVVGLAPLRLGIGAVGLDRSQAVVVGVILL